MQAHEDVFKPVSGLQRLVSSWYLVCCVATHIDHLDCSPKSDYLSSCTDLLGGNLQRSFITIQSILALSFNGLNAVLCFRERQHEYILFIHLSIADGLMGVYLGILAVVDFSYFGTFDSIIMSWTRHNLCIVSGCINFMSSEMALLLLAVMSVKRVKNLAKLQLLQKEHGFFHAVSLSLWSVCLMGAAGLFVATVMDILVIHNNMCLFIGIADGSIPSFAETMWYGIYIVLNITCLALLIICSVIIIHFVYKANIAASKSRTNALLAIRRLSMYCSSVVITNVLAWIPVLAVMVMALCDMQMEDTVILWMTLLVIPINATLNPVIHALVRFMQYLNIMV